MIDLTQLDLTELLIRAFFVGVMLGVVYDAIRMIKMLFGVRYNCLQEMSEMRLLKRITVFIITFILDLAFWIFAGIVSIILNYHIAHGIFRGMVYLGMSFGFVLYNLTLGRLMISVNTFLVSKVKKLIKKLLNLLFVPVKAVFFAIISLYHLTIGRFIDKIIMKIKIVKERRYSKIDSENLLNDKDLSADANDKVKEDYVYVDGKIGYRKSGRISFGKPYSN